LPKLKTIDIVKEVVEATLGDSQMPFDGRTKKSETQRHHAKEATVVSVFWKKGTSEAMPYAYDAYK
jgi:hypothetical protein